MRKLINSIVAFVMTAGLCASCTAAPVFAADYGSNYNTSYSFGSGPDSGTTFGKPSGYDEPARIDPLSTNERRDKNAAYLPPLYGVFSGDIPTNPSSLYHDNAVSDGYMEIRGLDTGYNGGGYADTSVGTAGGYGGNNGYAGSAVGGDGSSALTTTFPDAPGVKPATGGFYPSTSTSTSAGYSIAPKYYDDGSMGTLFISKLNMTIKVYEGESLENRKHAERHRTL